MNTIDHTKIAQVANVPVNHVRAYFKREQIPKALVSRIRTACGMLGVRDKG